MTENIQQHDECIICLRLITVRTSIATLACHHQFHLQCILRWFQEGTASCPCCRYSLEELPVEEDVDEEDTDTISIHSEDSEEQIDRLRVSLHADGSRYIVVG
jgi:hypothetical protein